MCFKKDFSSISNNWLGFLVEHLGPPTIGLSLRSFGSKISKCPCLLSVYSGFYNLGFMHFR